MCSQCGLPVSPSRKSCPRCGIPVKGMGEKGGPGQGALLFSQNVSFPPTKQEEENSNQQARETQSRKSYHVEQQSAADRLKQIYVQPGKTRASMFPGTSLNSLSRTRLGFTAAGICISIGALILIIVFIMSESLSISADTNAQAASQNKGDKVAATTVPVPSPEPSPTTLSVTPTPDTPGSKYIDNIQIGPAINMTSVEIVQPTKDFQAGQRIYITMNVNSIGYQGAVCLDWYVQNAFLTHYAFPTTADPSLPHSTAWSYATSMRRGPGYVNVSWASSVACTDKVLSQKVDFNVGG